VLGIVDEPGEIRRAGTCDPVLLQRHTPAVLQRDIEGTWTQVATAAE
jgi:hypothetical protein